MNDYLLQLLPDWSPTRSAHVVRVGALFKAPQGQIISNPSAMVLQLLDAQQNLIYLKEGVLKPLVENLSGPTWLEAHGYLINLDDTVKYIKGVLDEVCSDCIARTEANQSVVIKPIGHDLGLPNEPHLWWRFVNNSEKPIAIERIFRNSVLWLDGQALPVRQKSYNGPSQLPPGRALSDLWSLDDFDSTARWGKHLLQLEILDDCSKEISFSWNIPH